MIGAIIGDIAGSIYEWHNIKTTDFELQNKSAKFTDDTVLTIAVADAILHDVDFAVSIKKWGLKYPHSGYGGSFRSWLFSDKMQPYNSWGNGSAMRVSPVGYAYNSIEEVLQKAEESAAVTHNHPEGIKGAQATAAAIFLARQGKSKAEIKEFIKSKFSYNLNRTINEIRPHYTFDVSCQGSVPEAIIAFLESTDFESSIKLAISLGGDSDTIACICGGISQAFYGKIDASLIQFARAKLPYEMLVILDKFQGNYLFNENKL